MTLVQQEAVLANKTEYLPSGKNDSNPTAKNIVVYHLFLNILSNHKTKEM